MKARQKVSLNMSLADVILPMSEGNPGAATVLGKIIMETDYTEALMRILDLDDMNIRGPQIWVGFKDHCGSDLDTFLEKIAHRDKRMVETINAEMGMDPSYGHTAVTHRHLLPPEEQHV